MQVLNKTILTKLQPVAIWYLRGKTGLQQLPQGLPVTWAVRRYDLSQMLLVVLVTRADYQV